MAGATWQPTRRDALSAFALMCAGVGCSGSHQPAPSDSLSNLAAAFDRDVATAAAPCSLHSSHSAVTRLPADYAAFLETFGAGVFADGSHSFAIADLTKADDSTARDLFSVLHERDFRLGGESFTGFRGIPGIIPWGHDFQETTFYWIADSADPHSWRVAINGLAEELIVHSGAMVDFLAMCVLDRIPFDAAGSRFDQSELTFTPARTG